MRSAAARLRSESAVGVMGAKDRSAHRSSNVLSRHSGFPVAGLWTRTGTTLDGAASFEGMDTLPDFLARTEVRRLRAAADAPAARRMIFSPRRRLRNSRVSLRNQRVSRGRVLVKRVSSWRSNCGTSRGLRLTTSVKDRAPPRGAVCSGDICFRILCRHLQHPCAEPHIQKLQRRWFITGLAARAHETLPLQNTSSIAHAVIEGQPRHLVSGKLASLVPWKPRALTMPAHLHAHQTFSGCASPPYGGAISRLGSKLALRERARQHLPTRSFT